MREVVETLLPEGGFLPHVHCCLGRPALVWTMFTTDLLIGLAYVGIAVTLFGIVRRVRLPFNAVVVDFGAFIAACGGTHLLDVWTLWRPGNWWSASVRVVTALASVGTGIYLDSEIAQAQQAPARGTDIGAQRFAQWMIRVLVDTLFVPSVQAAALRTFISSELRPQIVMHYDDALRILGALPTTVGS